MTKVTYELTLTADSPMLIGGQYSSLVVDKMTARYSRGEPYADQPYLPASAIKGAMRIDFERLARSDPNKPEQICDSPHQDDICEEPPLCPACRLFGNPIRSGKLRFWDARLQGELPDPEFYYQTRTQVAINRAARRAEPEKLFDSEATATGLESELLFQMKISCIEPLSDDETALFERCLSWWKRYGLRIGAHRSHGWGRFSLDYSKVTEAPATFAASSTASPSDANPERALYLVTFEPYERLRVSGPKPRGYLRPTESFIPGSTLRGALGYALKRAGTDEATLDRIFLQQPPILSHLYPKEFQLAKQGLRPATAWRCKREEDHGPYDLLIHQFLYLLALDHNDMEQQEREQFRRPTEDCPDCHAPLKRSKDFPEIPRKLFTKLALNRTLMRHQPEMFYLYEAVRPRAFKGLMCLTDEQYQAFSHLGTVLIGGARSKGFGEGKLTIRRAAKGDALDLGDQSKLRARLESFNRKLQELAAKADPSIAQLEGRVYFTVDLLTDLILLPGRTLRELLDKEGWQWEIATVHWVWRGGYNESAGHQKPLVPALAKGGVVLLSTEAAPEGLPTEETIQRLLELENNGLGLKRDEGFGWVQICSPFHHVEVAPWPS